MQEFSVSVKPRENDDDSLEITITNEGRSIMNCNFLELITSFRAVTVTCYFIIGSLPNSNVLLSIVPLYQNFTFSHNTSQQLIPIRDFPLYVRNSMSTLHLSNEYEVTR